ncbi:MAG: hypothetical protein AB8G15_21000, partial [Saprospiraceae bacterium]
MKNLCLLSSLLLLFACTKKTNDQMVISTAIDLTVKNQAGEDLLDSQTEGYFSKDAIRLYYLVDGSLLEVNEPELDAAKGFSIFEAAKGYRIRIFP